ncbi:esterase-like activity of phytase family protein [Pseudoalteromonas sp. OOF1S-7]|uniref:esterase-like activity of phytase family protein n=1 Tax=Pseudoalteromonas sp. OOF1S-7 TaxID=2917757 RepID=UPI001EF4BD08|nr:esterase-like activity of phytase family protein [Pseudoalteromonas sp. OOF1S-7]MCG7535975.1 esterase-like activity of phytase family protein [Pseudoalteromonas sp. OOF1S-7]
MRSCLFLTLLAPFFANSAAMQLEFLDEFIVPPDLRVDGDKVGGLSSIEYTRGRYLLIADDSKKPRYFEANIAIKGQKIEQVQFTKSLPLVDQKTNSGVVDPESLRVAPNGKDIIWTSEGSIKYHHAPAIFMQTEQGVVNFTLPEMFNISKASGPRHNAVFEGLTVAHCGQGIWVSAEGALKQDGEESSTEHGSIVRISYFDFASKSMQKQFAYYLEPMVNRPEAKPDAFRTTGLVEILQLNAHQFLTMERSYTSGIADGGNDVSIYLIDIKEATDTSLLASLEQQHVRPARKTLLLDMAAVKQQLGSKHIDNLEGMTFGPKLANGNPSLLMVSDDNFNVHGKQLSQILLFEVKTPTPAQ